ncbi:MAG: phosphatase PAP2 family protein [Candidatus Acidiferrales bacterium]
MTRAHPSLRRLFAAAIFFSILMSAASPLPAQEIAPPIIFVAPLPQFPAPAPAFHVTSAPPAFAPHFSALSARTFDFSTSSPRFTFPALLAAAPVFNVAPPRPAYVTDPATGQRDVSWRLLPSNFLDDQRAMWLFPVQLAHGHHWLPTISVIGITGGLIVADPHDAPYFRRTSNFQQFNSAFSGTASAAGIVAVPALTYVVGLVRKDSYAQKTALFAGEAAADSFVLYASTNLATHRLRPSDISPQGNFSDTFYDGHRATLSNSFPSGHTTEAFAIATIFARRYRKHRWVPFLAYGAASVIAFSRITLQAHFPADVFLGAALGYSVARYDVLRGQ